jgi:circadian clock protein KaiC
MKKKKSVKKRVKKQKSGITRVSTGIIGVDKISQGGFEENSTNLVIGEGGSGKTIFGVQFLVKGIEVGERTIYISFEEKKHDFYPNMKQIGFDLENLEKKEKFFFLEYTPEKVKTMLEEGGGIIESLILRKKIKRVVIDSMTSFGLLFKNDLDKRESLLSLFNMLKKWECTTLLTYEGSNQDGLVTPDVLKLESDSIIIFYNSRGKKERERYIEIQKMRGTNHSSQLYNFTIGKKGIKLGKKASIKNLNPNLV